MTDFVLLNTLLVISNPYACHFERGEKSFLYALLRLYTH